MDIFFPKKPEKCIQKSREPRIFFFFKKPVKKIYMKKPTTKNRQDTKYLSYRHQGCYQTKAIKKHGIVTDTGKLTHETENSYR